MSLPSLKALIPTKQIGLVVEHATHAAAVTKAVVASQPVADTLQTAAQVIGEGVTDNATKVSIAGLGTVTESRHGLGLSIII